MTIKTAEVVGRTERVTSWADRVQFAGLASVGEERIGLAVERPAAVLKITGLE